MSSNNQSNGNSTHDEGERNFHVFYQLCAGAADSATLAAVGVGGDTLHLDRAASYRYLRCDDDDSDAASVVDGIDDVAELEVTVAAMRTLRFSDAAVG
jgi:myosin heavy subunit